MGMAGAEGGRGSEGKAENGFRGDRYGKPIVASGERPLGPGGGEGVKLCGADKKKDKDADGRADVVSLADHTLKPRAEQRRGERMEIQ